MENFDYVFRADVAKAKTTEELDKIAFNRVRSLARAQGQPTRDLLLGLLSLIKKTLFG